MSRMRLIGTVGGTVACALAIGYLMQRGQPVPPPIKAPAPLSAQEGPKAKPAQPAPPPGRVRIAEGEELDIQKIALTSAQPDAEPEKDILHMPATAPTVPAEPEPVAAPAPDSAADTPEEAAAPELSCDVTAEAVPGPMAMVDFKVSAPCLGNGRLVVHHNGMTFTAVTDDDGNLSVAIPALAERAVFIAAFDNGDGAVATARVSDVADYDRVVLQWQGKSGFQIHAREFGAAYGTPGHIWSGAAPVDHPAHTTGAVIRLGTDDALSPLLAEVYTFPSGAADRSGSIALSIEAEVTANNCGRDISAQLLQRQGEDRIRTRELELSVSDCGAIGDFLVLNNLLDDLKIAAK